MSNNDNAIRRQAQVDALREEEARLAQLVREREEEARESLARQAATFREVLRSRPDDGVVTDHIKPSTRPRPAQIVGVGTFNAPSDDERLMPSSSSSSSSSASSSSSLRRRMGGQVEQQFEHQAGVFSQPGRRVDGQNDLEERLGTAYDRVQDTRSQAERSGIVENMETADKVLKVARNICPTSTFLAGAAGGGIAIAAGIVTTLIGARHAQMQSQREELKETAEMILQNLGNDIAVNLETINEYLTDIISYNFENYCVAYYFNTGKFLTMCNMLVSDKDSKNTNINTPLRNVLFKYEANKDLFLDLILKVVNFNQDGSVRNEENSYKTEIKDLIRRNDFRSFEVEDTHSYTKQCAIVFMLIFYAINAVGLVNAIPILTEIVRGPTVAAVWTNLQLFITKYVGNNIFTSALMALGMNQAGFFGNVSQYLGLFFGGQQHMENLARFISCITWVVKNILSILFQILFQTTRFYMNPINVYQFFYSFFTLWKGDTSWKWFNEGKNIQNILFRQRLANEFHASIHATPETIKKFQFRKTKSVRKTSTKRSGKSWNEVRKTKIVCGKKHGCKRIEVNEKVVCKTVRTGFSKTSGKRRYVKVCKSVKKSSKRKSPKRTAKKSIRRRS